MGTGADVTELMLELYYFSWFILTRTNTCRSCTLSVSENVPALACGVILKRGLWASGDRSGKVAATRGRQLGLEI